MILQKQVSFEALKIHQMGLSGFGMDGYIQRLGEFPTLPIDPTPINMFGEMPLC